MPLLQAVRSTLLRPGFLSTACAARLGRLAPLMDANERERLHSGEVLHGVLDLLLDTEEVLAHALFRTGQQSTVWISEGGIWATQRGMTLVSLFFGNSSHCLVQLLSVRLGLLAQVRRSPY